MSVFKKTNVDEMGDNDSLFKDLIITWFALDDRIKEVNESLKELKDEKKQVEEAILQRMEEDDEEIIETSKGNLVRQKKESKSAITPELISQILAKSLKNDNVAQECTDEILKGRVSKETINLKRQIIKKRAKSDKNEQE